ncbi:radical SAM protein [Saccharibacillus sp. CPCC 101409]|uniref:radical SAM protein n=1 Tax=Saccharibacillus sp. CPCC 101409 TaxID=3058041 RepID=UPI00267276C8|nr:radical SAM protein [Saccharibacillus sp. CPCC 101409]MDO3409916.1 radical SAM protein [Saccharibacillus sp. CPCC 101409]
MQTETHTENKYKALELETPGVYELEGLEVGVTSNCNFACDYCCAYRRDDGSYIGADEVIRLISDIPTLKRVRLSAGEVTLKFEDCVQIVTYCSERGIATQLNTNGSLLSRERIRRLKRAGLSNIHLSFNFTDAQSFAAYYGMDPRVYEKVVENIRLCAEEGLETVLETLLFGPTQSNMPAISAKVHELGVRIHEIQNSIVMDHEERPGWNAVATREALVRSVSDLIAARRPDTELYFTCMDRFMERLGFKEEPGVYFSNCVDGKKQLHLHGNGDILICELCRPEVIGNVYRGADLKTIYANRPPALAEFLERLPCPAYDALFPAGE